MIIMNRLEKIDSDTSKGDLFYELPAGKRTIFVENSSDGSIESYFVPFPWLYFNIKYSVHHNWKHINERSIFGCSKFATLQVHLRSSPEQIKPEGKLYYFSAGNSYSDGICMQKISANSLEELIESNIEEYFSSPFTNSSGVYLKSGYVAPYEDWEVFPVDWTHSPYDLLEDEYCTKKFLARGE